VPATVQRRRQILAFYLCHFLHIFFTWADITDRTVRQHLGEELGHITEELDRLANETANENDPGPISF
jgi:hypothetical protein